MELKEIAATQRSFDDAHGWGSAKDDPRGTIRQLQEDVVGMVAELGEFANVVQKVARDARLSSAFPSKLLEAQRCAMTDELADVFIYLLRLANHLDEDLERIYLEKLDTNRQRFARYETDR